MASGIAVEVSAGARRRDEEYPAYCKERQRRGCARIGREDWCDLDVGAL